MSHPKISEIRAIISSAKWRAIWRALWRALQRWLAPPVFADESKTYLAALLNSTMLTVSALWSLGIVAQIILGRVSSWANIGIAAASVIGLLAAREGLRGGHVQLISSLLPALGFASTTLQVVNLGTVMSFHLGGYLLVITIATLLLGLRTGLFYTLLSLVTVWVCAYLEYSGIFFKGPQIDPFHQAFIFLLITIFAFGIVIAVRKVMDTTLYQARQDIKQRQQAEDALLRLNASLDQRVSERTRELEALIEKQRQAELALRARNESFSILHRSTLAFMRYHDVKELLQSLVDHAVEILDSPFCEIVALEGDELVVRAYSANQPYLEGDRSRRGTALLTWQAVDTREPAVVEDYSTWPLRRSLFENSSLHAAAELPIIVGVGDSEKCLGVLGLARTKPNYPYTPDEIEMGRLFTQIAGLAIENIQLQSSLLEQSLRDPLTGLHNRRYLFETLQQEFARAQRGQYPVSFVLLDIDHFKTLNDQCGHGAGDAVLRALADRLKSLVRAGDILCRYGGDEHMIVLYNTPSDVALTRTEQWRQSVQDLVVEYEGQPVRCTISIGVAVYPEHGASIDEVISRADMALYRSKNNGRNQTTLYRAS